MRPPWEPPRDGALDVVIDPGQAFGTGSHATTRLTLELLRAGAGGRAGRLGLRRGVLADLRGEARLGAGLACDVEVASVTATQDAARANEVSVEATRCDVRRGGPWAPTVLANLVRPLLLEVAAGLERVPSG